MSRHVGYTVFLISLIYACGTDARRLNCAQPECPPVDQGTGADHLLPFPEDCNKFISCDNGVQKVLSCGSGLHFNPTYKICDWPANAGCILCEATSTTEDNVTKDSTTTEEPTTEEITTEELTTESTTTEAEIVDPEPETPTQCTEKIAKCSIFSIYVYYPVPWNCSQYARCTFGITVIKNCAENKFYDDSAKLCVKESQTCVACSK